MNKKPSEILKDLSELHTDDFQRILRFFENETIKKPEHIKEYITKDDFIRFIDEILDVHDYTDEKGN